MLKIFGRGLLLLGPSQSGKSSLAFEALRHGHGLIADDAVEINTYTSSNVGKKVYATCPAGLERLLYSRCYGLQFLHENIGCFKWHKQHSLDAIVILQKQNIYQSTGLSTRTLDFILRADSSIPVFYAEQPSQRTVEYLEKIALDLQQSRHFKTSNRLPDKLIETPQKGPNA
jgi:HPr kinase/phosphorylase